MAVKALNLIMRLNFQSLLCMCIMTITIHAQEVPLPSVNIGDSAPPGIAVEKIPHGKSFASPNPFHLPSNNRLTRFHADL